MTQGWSFGQFHMDKLMQPCNRQLQALNTRALVVITHKANQFKVRIFEQPIEMRLLTQINTQLPLLNLIAINNKSVHETWL